MFDSGKCPLQAAFLQLFFSIPAFVTALSVFAAFCFLILTPVISVAQRALRWRCNFALPTLCSKHYQPDPLFL